MHDRDPEHGHHGVADEFLHRAPVPLEDFARKREVALHHPAQRLGIELLPERRRTGQVAEENRDDLADLAFLLGLETGTARLAEAGPCAVFVAARGACRHE